MWYLYFTKKAFNMYQLVGQVESCEKYYGEWCASFFDWHKFFKPHIVSFFMKSLAHVYKITEAGIKMKEFVSDKD